MIPSMGSELAKARMQDYHRAAHRGRLAEEARRARRGGRGLRSALGRRLVGMGTRLMGETVEVVEVRFGVHR